MFIYLFVILVSRKFYLSTKMFYTLIWSQSHNSFRKKTWPLFSAQGQKQIVQAKWWEGVTGMQCKSPKMARLLLFPQIPARKEEKP